MRFIRRPVSRGRDGGGPARTSSAEPLIRRSPLLFGYLAALGAIGAVATGFMLYGLRSIIFSVFLAMFATVGLDPLIRWFQRRGMTRVWAIVTVILLIVALLVAIVWVVVPLIVQQISFLATQVPKEITALRAEGWFDAAKGRICYTLGVGSLADPTMAHIHRGAAQVAGPVVVALANPAGNISETCAPVPAALINEIVANPAAFYVNVHTKTHPSGAIRAQLRRPK